MAFTNNQKEIVKAAISEKKDIEIVAGGEKFAATTKAFPKWTNAIVPYTFRGLGMSIPCFFHVLPIILCL